ncbi:MAG: DUF4301 family protein [Bacteroidales bacterium]|nr:DUF4301 family protein [Bacteroidales bacterium]
MFTKNDLKQFSEKGISKETVEKQIENFKKGFPYVNIVKVATINDGIIKLKDTDIEKYINLYNKISDDEKIIKFVPASGAASRMFKQLFEFMEDENSNIAEKKYTQVSTFFKEIENFAFYQDLKEICDENIDSITNNKKVLSCLLNEKGLNYGNLPKGLLKFHKYGKESRTPAEEHLVEGANYANSGGKVNVHFTVSPEHQEKFYEHIISVMNKYEEKYKVKFQINFSVQKNSTDTIAVTLENEPFRTEDNSILFRPGGHGALIENLNDIDADIIFVKNIDNVVHDKLKGDTFIYKKALTGLLVNIRNQVFEHIEVLNNQADDNLIEEIASFLERKLFIKLDNKFKDRTKEEKTTYLLKKLNRPIRVCGMVKNEGEPGGGPFFVKKDSGSVSLQIVEGAQIDMDNPEKAKIAKNATHFNPVDLILSVKDYKGNLFDLKEYVDFATGFISEKSKDGKKLKAQELPGLWNGAMANWLTVFVEVPVSTFNPVKVVNDLLRTAHQE